MGAGHRNPPKYTIEYLVRQFHAFINGVTGRDNTDVDLLLTRQTDACDHACAHVDQRAIRSGDVRVGIEHLKTRVGEQEAKAQ